MKLSPLLFQILTIGGLKTPMRICLCCPSIACKMTRRTLETDESSIVPGLLEVLVFYSPLFRELSMEAVTVLT